MKFKPLSDTPSELILSYRELYLSRQSHTWTDPVFAKNETIVCAGDGPSLKAHRADKILTSGMGLICCNSSGIWAQRTIGAQPWNFCQIIVETKEFLRDDHMTPFRVPTYVSPSKLTREWLDFVRITPDYQVLLTSFSVFKEEGKEVARPDHLLFPSYDLPHDGINLCGNSVLLSAIQLAVHFGATRVILIGTDMDQEFSDFTRNSFIAFRESMKAYGVLIEVDPGKSKIDVLPEISLSEEIK